MKTHPKLGVTGNIIWRLKVARFWHDGDGASFLWNLWNPLCWPLLFGGLFCILIMSGVMGLKDFPGLTLTDYWKQHKKDRVFF